MPQLFIAVDTFVSARRGRSEWVSAGDIAEPGSWPLEAHPAAFRPLEIRFKAPPRQSVAPGEKPVEPKVDAALLQSPAVSPQAVHRKSGGGRPRQS